jgi:putative peptidoglycan lipid II flippase
MVAILAAAQTVNMLPVSLFGIAISAAELPALSSIDGFDDEQRAHRRARLTAGSRQIAFFVVPSAVAFLLFGDTIFRILFERRRFLPADTMYGWGILAASSLGLLAGTLARLYSTMFYALGDTRRPMRYALVRVAVALLLGWFLALRVPAMIGLDPHWGAVGLGLASGVAAWTEFTLLRSRLKSVIGDIPSPAGFILRLWLISAVAGAAAFAIKGVVAARGAVVEATLVFAVFGALYLALAILANIPEARTLLSRIRRRA